MAATGDIIIKKIKKVSGGGHHGGAWKVAYADFVTAMMAFFLLLWLINVTTPAQKMGLAEYFTPTMGVKDNMGIGFKGGKMPTPDVGRANTDMNAVGLVVGQIHQGPVPVAPDVSIPVKPEENAESTSTDRKASQDATDATDGVDSDEFRQAQEEIKQSLENDPNLQTYKNNILVRDTPEGLKIDMVDDPRQSMFVPGGAILTETGKKILDSMANIIRKTPNHITITGHTDASGASSDPNYTNWELSADRANAARRGLFTTQLEADRVGKVMGLADRELLMSDEPSNPRNRRVTIILQRGSYFRDPKAVPITRTLLSVPDSKIKKEEAVKPDAAPTGNTKPAGSSIFDQPQSGDKH